MAFPDKIDAVRLSDTSTRPTYSSDVKKKNPWEEIGAAFSNIGTSFQQYINTGDVSVFGKTGSESRASFEG